MPGLVFVCSPGRPPWVYAALNRPTDPEQHLFRAPAFNCLQRREGLPRKPPVLRGGGTDTGVLLPVLLLAYRGFTRDRSKKHADNLVKRYGRR